MEENEPLIQLDPVEEFEVLVDNVIYNVVRKYNRPVFTVYKNQGGCYKIKKNKGEWENIEFEKTFKPKLLFEIGTEIEKHTNV